MAAYWQKWRAKNVFVLPKPCSMCGKEFTSTGSHKRCEVCRTLKCHQCQQPFKSPNSSAQKFCSRKCKDAALRGFEPPALAANRGKKPRTSLGRNRSKRGCAEDREWRLAVFTRDNFTCVMCDKRGGRLQADHIKPFGQFPELRIDVSNGRTLCVKCHQGTDTYGWKGYWKKVRATRLSQEVLTF